MDWKQIPTLNSLRAFHLVAETGGYTRAAETLNVTHAAIIQQVKALERHLGTTLIERTHLGRTVGSISPDHHVASLRCGMANATHPRVSIS